MKQSHVILTHHLIIISVIIELIFFIVGGTVAYTILNNELIKSKESPSTTGDVHIIFPGSCKDCDLEKDCENVPSTALDMCNGHKMWLKTKGE